PIASPQQTTTYVLTVTSYPTECIAPFSRSDTVTVIVEPPCLPPTPPEQSIEVYNIFTPNNDLKNEVFYIKNLPANSSLQIFNRWGMKVFSSGNYNNTWDGGGVPDGTYFYLLVLPDKEVIRGFLEIRR
ncbi:MAG: gliding motility-associated C-terminal domain-containing protein, partial [Bacteroidia bacterium]|nr:gliding motility-associated C-terminal domain-containing protein [Bacteroidia bacterium]